MKKRRVLFLWLCCVCYLNILWAQDKTVSGTVTDKQDGAPLPGVNVVVKGTTTGTATDFDGNYTLQVPEGAILQFSALGYKSLEIPVQGETTVNASLGSDTQQLEGVVVTALGIKRDEKALTYASQEIGSDELTRVKEVNPINSLAGKSAGVVINRSSAGAGGSVKVVLRGNSSTRSNQPLYVIDGVPMLNTPDGGRGAESVFGGGDTGDALSLINPDDIESMSILRGASASALYGSQGANGVILITTKSGKAGKTTVTVSSNTTFDKVINLPKTQYSYTALDENGNAGYQSWGVKGASPNHMKDFFNTGVTSINSVTMSAGNEKAQTYFSYSYTDVQGVVPTNSLTKHTFNFRETADFFDGALKVDANITLSDQGVTNRPVSGFYFNPINGAYLFPRGLDYNDYKNNYAVFDQSRNLYTQNWTQLENEQQNPYWILNKNRSEEDNQRLVGSVKLDYKATDWLTFKSRLSYDRLFNTFDRRIYAGTLGVLGGEFGRYMYSENTNTQTYADILAVISRTMGDFDVSATLGSSVTRYTFGRGVSFDGLLRYANLFNVDNFLNPSGTSHKQTDSRKEIQSVFSSINLGYKSMLYLDFTARNDWSSTLVNSGGNISYFYPSVGFTGLISEMVTLPEFMNFLKVRASYSEVGNDIPAFITTPVQTITAGVPSFPTVGLLDGQPLKPERQKSHELGLEARFFDSRLSLDFTYYRSNTVNQYFEIEAPSTNPNGFSFFAVNAGDIQNTGYEISLSGEPIAGETFNWNTQFNFATNENIVKNIHPKLNGRANISTSDTYRYAIVEGRPFGVIESKTFVKDDQGRMILNPDGSPRISEDYSEVGNVNPDWTLGWNNQFNYKNFTLNFLIDARVGGEVMSLTEAYLDQYGVSQRSAQARDYGGVDVNAVMEDGTPVSQIDAQTYYNTIGGRNGVGSEYVYDATNVLMREIGLGYTFEMPEDHFIKSLKVSVIGRNLFFFYKDAPFDPNITLNTGNKFQGVELFSVPNTRSMGVNFNITF
ncbi:SusC/RagA family TonB-linked outer membrane protein [Sinomicrobium weinanense]|uniref:SusC/RagA family TonB-linked outer membrane protein n=1 Tax=Sinomicrobium weinanense TaxID=2842200 RepID=A0A926JNS1_9FLAO|nr:SusC/RagA family TonB-linked outer membrane protein [Sinomicrobium weinanense]MBC9794683.1 SusC/RagA family TonB-linked outer membrane protein [Sinomicrobium weinanense]MBU3124168.1 SusC/RagA family TonB-linked outer membrane protein [Sinomicrobium weinanense]